MRSILFLLLCSFAFGCSSKRESIAWPAKTFYRYYVVNGYKMFYREAGDPGQPTILLLHGFPSSSHAYRELIPMLSGKYHVLAPDNLGSGFSDRPDPAQTRYTFDLLAQQIDGLMDALKVESYYIYMHDFGAPVGYRLALKNPEKLKGLIIQNANAYMEGLSDQRREFFMTAGDEGSAFPIEKLYDHVSREFIINNQYLRDVKQNEIDRMSPDTWTHDSVFLQSKKDQRIQVELFRDYRSNLLLYPAWQEFLRSRQPPTLIVWGKHDPVFMAPGATAYLRDLPDAELHLIDAGHFALEESPYQIARLILEFLENT